MSWGILEEEFSLHNTTQSTQSPPILYVWPHLVAGFVVLLSHSPAAVVCCCSRKLILTGHSHSQLGSPDCTEPGVPSPHHRQRPAGRATRASVSPTPVSDNQTRPRGLTSAVMVTSLTRHPGGLTMVTMRLVTRPLIPLPSSSWLVEGSGRAGLAAGTARPPATDSRPGLATHFGKYQSAKYGPRHAGLCLLLVSPMCP